ncbi:MAG: mevalonate kinase [Caldilineaceae bacterium]|nr:mevalonate kinase [Caldilineaceae bacterium]MCB0125857.1 mevalonate kinase [Caldilineaceae bacterium]
MTQATAPGKIILVGEHAVVYGRPAIAVPVWERVAQATIRAGTPGSGCIGVARDLGRTLALATAHEDEPLALVTRLTLAQLGIEPNPDWHIEVSSQIPIASGLGSGAALSAALVRAIYAHVGQPVTAEQVSALVYESERLYHGTPSGIDNTVIAHGVPIWFVKGQPPEPFTPQVAFTIVIADSGIAAPTKETVGDVRRAWQADPMRYEGYFDAIQRVVEQARTAMETGQVGELGRLFNANQQLLAEIGVSSAPLERLIDAALGAGALGAKLSGGGRGGNVIALVTQENATAVANACLAATAKSTVTTTVYNKASIASCGDRK